MSNIKIKKTEQEWREQLSDAEFNICRMKGTERAFTGEYYNCKNDGIYTCTCCGAELFDSIAKYDSGSGWPSFFQPIQDENIIENIDKSHGMTRTEIVCSDCDSHLGHVFSDGPNPTGLRYCVNSASLKLKPKSD